MHHPLLIRGDQKCFQRHKFIYSQIRSGGFCPLSESTETNEVRYRLKATIEWTHVGYVHPLNSRVPVIHSSCRAEPVRLETRVNRSRRV